MGDFVKIFFVLCAIVAAFFIGKGYGEQTYLASEDYKNIAKTKEELEYAKGELENAKAKLQNIMDRGDKEKTDELLSQILQVFLADLGLQIQNRDLIIQQAKAGNQNSSAVVPAPKEEPQITIAEIAIQKIKESERREAKELQRFQDLEKNLLSSSQPQNQLDKVSIKDLKKWMAKANPEMGECEPFLGRFRGDLIGVTKRRQGSIFFELGLAQNLFSGMISWLNSPNPPISTNINGTCGLKIPRISARFFTLSDNRYLQVYPGGFTAGSEPKKTLGGILYEILPAGSTQKIGTFWIKKSL